MKRLGWLLKTAFHGLLVLMILAQVLRDTDTPRRRPPVTTPLPNPPLPYLGESQVVGEPGRRSSAGSAFSVAASGRWLTARHVVEDCDLVGIVTPDEAWIPVISIVESDTADAAFLKTATGGPAFDLAAVLPAQGALGFHFGFPRGQPGEAASRLMGIAGARRPGRAPQGEPVLVWAELSRNPRFDGPLSGLSGGVTVNADGRVVGISIASSRRRGRILTAHPDSVRELLEKSGFRQRAPRPALGAKHLTRRGYTEYGKVARKQLSVAKVVCWVKPAADSEGS